MNGDVVAIAAVIAAPAAIVLGVLAIVGLILVGLSEIGVSGAAQPQRSTRGPASRTPGSTPDA